MVSQANLGAKVPARIKSLLVKELVGNWQGMESFVVVCPVGLNAVTNNQLRATLFAKNIKMTVVKNSLARLALAELNLADGAQLLDAPSAICFGGESVVDVAREMINFARGVDVFTVRGAFVEGQVFSSDQVRKLAAMPNRSELSAQIVCLVLAPGRRIASVLVSPAGRIAGAIEALVDKLSADAPPTPAVEPDENTVSADGSNQKIDTPEPAQTVEASQAPATTDSAAPTDAANTPDDSAEKKDAPEPASDSDSKQQASEEKQ